MKRSRADKAATHSKILAVAAKRFRERGLNGISLADVMKEAGSSAGGFYKHFNSREELEVEALAESFKFLDRLASKAEDLPAFVDALLSDEHHDNPGTGCALTALVNDVRNASSAVRTVYTQRVKQTAAYYTDHLDRGDANTRNARAITLMCAVGGGLAIARAINDKALSQAILKALREDVKSLISFPEGPTSIAKKRKIP